MRKFGVPAVVAINHFTADTEAEIDAGQGDAAGARRRGGAGRPLGERRRGREALAERVVALVDERQRPVSSRSIADDMPLFEKIDTIAHEIYRADERRPPTGGARPAQAAARRTGYGDLPVCIAKTQYSFSTDPARSARRRAMSCRSARCGSRPAPASSSAICGDIMTMPGLPRVPAADAIDVVTTG